MDGVDSLERLIIRNMQRSTSFARWALALGLALLLCATAALTTSTALVPLWVAAGLALVPPGAVSVRLGAKGDCALTSSMLLTAKPMPAPA